VKTRTVSDSANPIRPVTTFPAAVTWTAAAVVRRSIRSVNRTDRTASRATSRLPSSGRERTTDGASTVLNVAATSPAGAPSASTTPDTDRAYAVAGSSPVAGRKVRTWRPSSSVAASRVPATAGTIRSPARTESGSTARSQRSCSVVSSGASTAVPSAAACAPAPSTATDPRAIGRVRNAMLIGREVGRPAVDSAPAAIVTT
jgi:hypothetical protein